MATFQKSKVVIIPIFLRLTFLLHFLVNTKSQSIIKTLPGYDGDLPFKLETGYIGAGENEELQLFYYFVESERDPRNDPLLIVITGGPGCSGLGVITYGSGPFALDPDTYGSSLPSVVLRPYSWTKVANIIYLDWPMGTGFSYTNNPKAYYTNDSASPKDIYSFLQKWLLKHPQFIQNPLYVCGGSYGGKITPMLAWEILEANEAGLEPKMSLKGYFVLNPVADAQSCDNDKYLHAHNLALIPDEYIMRALSSCKGGFVNPNSHNIPCQSDLQDMNKCLEGVNTFFVLDPGCPKSDTKDPDQILAQENPIRIKLPSDKKQRLCPVDYPLIVEQWANIQSVREALHVREGTKGEWLDCNRSVAYDYDVKSTVPYHHLLIKKGYKALVISGDHDLVAPYINSLKWIRSLKLPVDEKWRPWKVEDQVAGYTTRYHGNGSYLTFATIRGSGHNPPRYTPKQCYAVVSRWLSGDPL